MKLSSVVVTLLLTAGVAYYVYTPLPAAIEEPLKLMLLDALFHVMLQVDYLCQSLGQSRFSVVEGAMSVLVSLGNMAGGHRGGVRVSDVDFDGIPVRVYEPPAVGGGEGGPRRAVMFYHGGGWAFGTSKKGSYDILCRQMSDELNAVVVSVEYRLAPAVHFPVQYEDCLRAAKHFLQPGVLGSLSVDPQRVAVSGDSAGGNLAAAVAQEISSDDSGVRFSVQALIYPVLQGLDFHTPSHQQNQNIPILHRYMMARFWLLYMGVDTSLSPLILSPALLHHPSVSPSVRSRINWATLLPPKHIKHYKPAAIETGPQGLKNPEVEFLPGLLDVRSSPLLAEQGVLGRTPRALIITCEYDVLRDDGLMYGRRLQDAGVKVTNVHHDDGFHGCASLTQWPFSFDVGKRVIRGYIDWLQENL
ncbi:neutral cholesterol ester hydrolase 1a [Esox lucius]|uniref:Neutral cholesterol ester hydrolase 1 n=1 Tax=Esox lucius TaxID=8010 RepID=A0A3P8XSC8_ESOLU|nr:neutral cholesterol ester hydrolase 1a [Esox lucius]